MKVVDLRQTRTSEAAPQWTNGGQPWLVGEEERESTGDDGVAEWRGAMATEPRRGTRPSSGGSADDAAAFVSTLDVRRRLPATSEAAPVAMPMNQGRRVGG